MTILQVLTILLGAASVAAAQETPQINYPGRPWVPAEYSTSPEVLPSPKTTGTGWETSFQQATDFVSNLTLEEKIQIITGTSGPCVGNIAPIPRLSFSGLCLQDGPLAIRQADYASVFPAGLTVAASWDRKLARKRGQDLGEEFRGKGAHVILGPVAGPLGRSSRGGRNWEGFSPDPYLTGILFEESILGVQERGVQVCGKHYIGNEQEVHRVPVVDGTKAAGTSFAAVSANIDDQTMHEVYLWPFANAVKQGMSSIMCSYNRLNSTYGCENSKTLNGLLKEELGFQGWVVSDWGATHSSYQAANAGLDMTMPGWIYENGRGSSWFGANATLIVQNKTLSMNRLDDMCLRIMIPSSDLNNINPSIFNYSFPVGPSHVDVRADHAEHIRELGAAGIVLLKNLNETLPLKHPKNIAVIGNAAADITTGLYPEQDADAYVLGWDIGTQPLGGGSGSGRFSYVVSPLEAIKARAKAQKNNALVQYVLNNSVITNADGFTVFYPPPEVCLVFLKSWAREGYDRPSLLVDWNGTALVEKVASQCSNTVVVTNSVGVNVLAFADNPNVTAILAAHLGGQEQGNSIVDVLWGSTKPSGKLPYTIPLREEDFAFSDITNSTELLASADPNAWQSNFEERLLIDYRWFDYHNLTVQYEFGFGLSYTTFSVGNLKVKRLGSGSIPAIPPNSETMPGGNPELWKVVYEVKVTVTNTGSVLGDAVPQLYVGLPQPNDGNPVPVKVLRGFEKVKLGPGQVKEVKFELMRRDLSYWDVMTQQWMIAPGEIKMMVGLSSRDIQATASLWPLKEYI
ncbi:putative beta-glucosidase G [Pseudocercospora fuligena]|uniref:Probable beta-glucosidase G n=1 Tax=Pseudocercospora fuligena TaxID=685502 RepID=A0A8H6RCE2_9PEZI|nr:putative beta-glucosidase G [Pseudocercospora fuligena]